MANKIAIAKNVVHFIVGSGVTAIVRSIVRDNTDPQKIHEKISIACGSMVLGAMAADASKQYTDAKIDEIVDWWTKNIKPRLNN